MPFPLLYDDTLQIPLHVDALVINMLSLYLIILYKFNGEIYER